MIRTTVKIEGMSCSMCEAHINDCIRKAVPGARKVSSSHTKGEASFQTEGEVDHSLIKSAIEGIGYGFISAESQTVEKKGFFHFGK